MAKKNYGKFLTKAGSTVAVAVAMTVALSTQVSAAELDDTELLNSSTPPVEEQDANVDLNLDGMAPAEANAVIDESNEEIVAENQETAVENEQTQKENNEAAENNEIITDGELVNPELNLPDAPEAPNTEGMSVEEYNNTVGEYNDKVDEYNDAANNYNDKVDEYNDAADAYDKQEQEKYDQEKDAYDQEKEAHDAAAKDYADYEAELTAYEAEKARLEAEYQAALEAYNAAKAEHGEQSDAYAKYEAELEAYEAEKARLEAEHQAAMDAYNTAKENHKAETDAYAKYEAELEAYEAEKTRLEAEHKTALDAYNERLQQSEAAWEAYNAYLAKQAEYEAAQIAYEAKLKQYEEDFEQYLQDYLEQNGANDAAYQEYLAAKAEYEQALALYNAFVTENTIFQDVTEYNEDIDIENGKIDDLNAALDNDVDGNADNISSVGSANQKIEIDQEILDVLNGYEDLAKEQENLEKMGAALESHEGKNAKDLASQEYADYLAAVEAYNAAVETVNSKIDAYNKAVTEYNEAVNAYNEAHKDSSSSSTGENSNNGTADWGNFGRQNLSFNHIDVRYQAAVVKDKVVNADGSVSYSDSYSKYDIVGVYYDKEAADTNPYEYGVTYTNKQGQEIDYEMTKDDDHSEFCTASTDRHGNIDRTDASANKNAVVAFYATLNDGQGISIRLDANSVYAENSYYKYDRNDHLDDFRDSNGKALPIVTIDGQRYYDISGQSVYLISALACDGYAYRLGGLDLILNMQTIIEIYQADKAQTVSYLDFQKGKTAQIVAPTPVAEPDALNVDMLKPVEPTEPTPVVEPDVFEEVEPELNLPKAPDPVNDPGEFDGIEPELNLPKAPDPVNDPGEFDGIEPELNLPKAPDPVNDPGEFDGIEPELNLPKAPDPVNDPGEFEGVEPELNLPKAPDPVNDPGEFEGVEPELNLPKAPDPINDPGEFEGIEPELNLPKAPDPVNDPGKFDKTELETPVPTHRLEPVGKLDKLNEKLEIIITPVEPEPDPGPQPQPHTPQPFALDGDDLVTIDDGAVPLADVPKTGDASVVFGAMSAFSGFGLAFLQMFGRKKKEEN